MLLNFNRVRSKFPCGRVAIVTLLFASFTLGAIAQAQNNSTRYSRKRNKPHLLLSQTPTPSPSKPDTPGGSR
ncbi:hypothetical protein IQ249_23295 [Lusitaniella coriacea LEGE 07157]|uniref:Uncharacterized protein n=1 Tax=Lusitaniella coriacea LEGE 07157 TaxID=945747 RepID=A0A8J7J6N8_9CYAN|nr:hypothetical protein [Lusitaniella coriacea]MBE9118819.1 hypothetical protein [Lusitaniella coriacea LEGE 07157]